MASTYSSSLNLQLITTGEKSGTWGSITNENLQKLTDQDFLELGFPEPLEFDSSEGEDEDFEKENAVIDLFETLSQNYLLFDTSFEHVKHQFGTIKNFFYWVEIYYEMWVCEFHTKNILIFFCFSNLFLKLEFWGEKNLPEDGVFSKFFYKS